MAQRSFQIDTSQITALARQYGGPAAQKIVRDELSTAMLASTQDVQTSVTERINHRSGNYARSFARRVQVTATGVIGIITNNARSAAGFVYAWTLEHGRGPVFAKRAKALRFEIGGQVLFRKSVGPAKAQYPMAFGARDAEPRIHGRFLAARDKIARRLEAMR